MANLVLSLAQAYAAYARVSLIRKARRPLETQSQFLLRLLRVQQNTELGKTFGLSEIRSVDQFRERVPILPYASYEPYTDRIALGEPNVLNADPVIYINLTSGSNLCRVERLELACELPVEG